VRFEWDPRKAETNFQVHGIRFAEAATVFVVYAYREPDIIRMLSAWRANKRQREAYEKGRS
jgi:uncharacterized DUF497 family protein